eukprot:8557564-Alexandrium_andersonii.AAC.1
MDSLHPLADAKSLPRSASQGACQEGSGGLWLALVAVAAASPFSPMALHPACSISKSGPGCNASPKR